MSKSHRRALGFRLLVAVVILLLVLGTWPRFTRAQTKEFDDIISRVTAVSGYTFTTDVEQTLLPRPVVSMIGQTSQRVDMRIDGQVQVPDYSEITVRFEGGDAALPVIGLVQEGPDTFLLQDGERIPVENPAHLAAPTGDYTLYLSAAENVQRQVDENGRTYFTFTVSGDRLARLVRDYLQANLPPGAPPNTQLSPSPYLQRISGSGELWLDDAGLPLRQVLQLTIPEASETYDANVRTITHFRFPDSSGEESLLPPPGAMLDTPPATASTAAAASTSAAGTTAVSPGPSPLNTAALASTLLLITAFALLVVVLLRYKVRRTFTPLWLSPSFSLCWPRHFSRPSAGSFSTTSRPRR